MELILIRHARPHRAIGSDDRPADPELSPTGRAQADALARWLAGERIDRIYSSPSKRALQTADPLAGIKQITIDIEPRIAEFDRNEDSYIPLEELKATDYERWLDLMHGGYAAEHDLVRFRSEVVRGVEDIIGANSGRRVALFCHGGVINAWAVHVLDLGRPLFFDPHYTSMNRFFAARTGERSLESLNETPHLSSEARRPRPIVDTPEARS